MRLFYYYNHPVLREVAFLLPPLFQWRAGTFRAAIEMFRDVQGTAATFLDVGCGSGAFTRRLSMHFPNARIDAIDITPRMINFAVKRNRYPERVRFRVGNFMAFDGDYDAVFALYTIMLLPLKSAVEKLLALAPNGTAIFNLTIPNTLMRLHRAFYSIFIGSQVNLYPVQKAVAEISEVAQIVDLRHVATSEGSYLIAVRRKR